MKTNFLKHILLLVVFTTIFSCSKNDDAPDPKTFQYRLKEVLDTNNLVSLTYEYNNQNQVIKKTQRNSTPETYLYDSRGYLVQEIDISGNRITYVRDANGILLEKIKYQNNTQRPLYKTIYTNNTAGYVIESKEYNYKLASSSYEFEYNTLYTYNSKNQLITEETPEFMSNNNLVLSRSYNYEYDDRGNQTIRKTKVARVSGGNLFITSQSKYVFDNIKPIDYPNSTLSKNNLIEYQDTNYLQDGTVATQYTTIINNTYNEAGYLIKASQPLGSLTYVLEKIN
jgi:YD repeat-containing protein